MAALHHPVVQGVKGFLTWLWDPALVLCRGPVLLLQGWPALPGVPVRLVAGHHLHSRLRRPRTGAGRLVRKRWVHPVSAVMTGISIWYPADHAPEYLLAYVVGAAIAIGSKTAVRHRGRHVFNPSNLAVALLFLVAPQYGISNPSQWTNQIWPAVMILLLGAVVVTPPGAGTS